MKKLLLILTVTILYSCASSEKIQSIYYVEPQNSRDLYTQEERKLYEDFIQNPPVPLRLPDTIVRVLIMPYVDREGVLHTYKYVFVKVEDGKWVFKGKVDATEDSRVMKPLEDGKKNESR